MMFYITFRQSSGLGNNFVKLDSVDDIEAARKIANELWPKEFLMVYNENQWHDYQGVSIDKRHNLTEIITW